MWNLQCGYFTELLIWIKRPETLSKAVCRIDREVVNGYSVASSRGEVAEWSKALPC